MNAALLPAKLATARPARVSRIECALLLALAGNALAALAAPPAQTPAQSIPMLVAVPGVVPPAHPAMPGPALPVPASAAALATVAVPGAPLMPGNIGGIPPVPAATVPAPPQAAATGGGRQGIQLVNMTHESTGKSPAKLSDAQGQPGLGARGGMCVVSTLAGRGVRLSFRSGNGAFGDGRSWTARHVVTGAARPYRQSVSLADGSGVKLVSADPAGTYDVPAAAVANSLAACPPGGNVIKWSTYQDKEAGVFRDSVTVTAVPL